MKAFPVPVMALAAAALVGAAAQAQTTTARRPLNPQPVPSAAAAPAAPTVGGVTVQPATPPQGRVVSSTDAAPLTSPYYTDQDAQPAPRALSLGDSAAVGVETVDTAPVPGAPNNLDPGGPHGGVGVTAVF